MRKTLSLHDDLNRIFNSFSRHETKQARIISIFSVTRLQFSWLKESKTRGKCGLNSRVHSVIIQDHYPDVIFMHVARNTLKALTAEFKLHLERVGIDS